MLPKVIHYFYILLLFLEKESENLMPTYKSFAELKALARMQMRGNNTALIGAFLLQELIALLASSLLIVFIPGTDTASTILSFVVSLVLQLLIGIVQIGAHLLFLHAACNMRCQISDLFSAFRSNTDKAIKVQIPLVLISAICSLPSTIYSWHIGYTEDYTLLMNSYLIMIGGLLVNAFIMLFLFPLLYLYLDFPDQEIDELYRKSVSIMKGNKLRLFLLELSFIPAMLLGFVTCGLALFWVIPYRNVTLTNFYLDIMSQRNKQQQTDNFF